MVFCFAQAQSILRFTRTQSVLCFPRRRPFFALLGRIGSSLCSGAVDLQQASGASSSSLRSGAGGGANTFSSCNKHPMHSVLLQRLAEELLNYFTTNNFTISETSVYYFFKWALCSTIVSSV